MKKAKTLFSGAVKTNHAFTLAEVLITLGIIGVVAAITLPTVMTKVEKNIRKEQFKKVFSTYSQALQRAAMDFDGMPACGYQQKKDDDEYDYSTTSQLDCPEFYEKFAKYMNVIKTCRGNALAENCIPKYTQYKSGDGCGGFSEHAMNNRNTSYVLMDGTIMMPYESNTGSIVAFDINGKKGPNTPGQDLFAVDIVKTHNGMLKLATHTLYRCIPNPPESMDYEDFFK